MKEKCCSDFDDDCQKVKNPLSCWIGGTSITRNGEEVWTPISDGFCPLLRQVAPSKLIAEEQS